MGSIHGRALAVALAIGFVGSDIVTVVAAPGDADLPMMRERTVAIATEYLRVWSSNDGGAVASVPYIYGPTVLFYGRTYTRAQLMDEKRRAVRQWPLRRYTHRPGTMQVICNAPQRKCAARSITDFNVENPHRGTAKHGAAKFDLGVSFAGDQPRILYEGGSLNRPRR